jgi:RNA methyltransferase, TrmH family
MNDKPITSAANPLIKRIRALHRRRYREEWGAFFVEGIRPVWQALASGAEVEVLVHAPQLLTSEAARQMIETRGATGTKIVRVSAKVFESIALREHPSGLGAVVRISSRALDDMLVTSSSVFVALDQVGNPGNIGTIVRTLDAVGGKGLILVGNSADPYDPAAVKASMGTLFKVPIVHVATLEQVLAWCDTNRVSVITTSPRAPTLYWSVDYSLPSLFLFGSEGEGLTGETVERGDQAVRIPMAGAGDSLNLAVSVGVVLYEVERQRSSVTESLKALG